MNNRKDKQGIYIFHTEDEETRDRVLRIQHFTIGNKYTVKAYLATPDACGKGVIHGIHVAWSIEIWDGIAVHADNNKVIGVRRIGTTKTVAVTFDQPQVPRKVRVWEAIYPCFLFKK